MASLTNLTAGTFNSLFVVNAQNDVDEVREVFRAIGDSYSINETDAAISTAIANNPGSMGPTGAQGAAGAAGPPIFPPRERA